MNIQEYEQIRRSGLIKDRGSISRQGMRFPWGTEGYNEHVIPKDILASQLTCPIDFKNLIILCPLGTGYGTNRFFKHGNIEVLIDHSTYSVGVRYLLKNYDIKYKTGKSVADESVTQLKFGMMVIKDGIACDKYGVIGNYHSADPRDVPKNLQNLNIIFSGYFLERFRKN